MQDAVKENIVSQIRQILKTANENQKLVDEKSSDELFSAIEAIFLHGLQNAVQNRNSETKLKTSNFWPIIRKHSHKGVLEFIEEFGENLTNTARCRIWIRLAIGGCELSAYLALILKDFEIIKLQYEIWSFIRDVEKMRIFNGCLRDLESMEVNYDENYTSLYEWSDRQLILAGLILPPIRVLSTFSEAEVVVPKIETHVIVEEVPPSEKIGNGEAQIKDEGHDRKDENGCKVELELQINGTSKVGDDLQSHHEIIVNKEPNLKPNPDNTTLNHLRNPEEAVLRSNSLRLKSTADESAYHSTSLSLKRLNLKGARKMSRVLALQQAETIQRQDSIHSTAERQDSTNQSDEECPSRTREDSFKTSLFSYWRQVSIKKKTPFERISVQTPVNKQLQRAKSRSADDVGATTESSNDEAPHDNREEDEEDKSLDSNFLGPSVKNFFVKMSTMPIATSLRSLQGYWTVLSSDSVTANLPTSTCNDMSCILRRVGENSLSDQKFKCHSDNLCEFPLDGHNSRRCFFDGKFYCLDCHGNQSTYIPARILFEWDFNKYPVSNRNLEYLKKIHEIPMLDIQTINADLYQESSDLTYARLLRRQSRFIGKYIFSCVSRDAEKCKKTICPRHYYFSDIDRYSIKDLVSVKLGDFMDEMEKCNLVGIEHVRKCKTCSVKGFYCEVCRSRDLIFPFDIHTTVSCDVCKNTYHIKCRTVGTPCPKCERLNARAKETYDSE